ncbi:MAG: prepilin-type N-terminal cleavage/methylation domain-containing protein [bacterium]
MKIKGKNTGFTMVEVVVVAVIMGILAVVAVPLYTGYVENSRCTTVRNWAETAAAAAGAWEADFGKTPTWAEIHSDPSADIKAWTDVGAKALSNGLNINPVDAECGNKCPDYTIQW